MGCGRKAWEEAEEDAAYEVRKACLAEMRPSELLNLFDKLKGNFYSRQKEMTTATRYQFNLLDHLNELLKKLP